MEYPLMLRDKYGNPKIVQDAEEEAAAAPEFQRRRAKPPKPPEDPQPPEVKETPIVPPLAKSASEKLGQAFQWVKSHFEQSQLGMEIRVNV